MNLNWYYHRLKSMSFREVLWRIRQLCWKYQSRFLRKFWQHRFHRMAQESTRICNMIESIDFFGLSSSNPLTVSLEIKKQAVEAGDMLLSHWFECFGHEIQLPQEIQWNREIKRDIELPLKFSPMMDYRDTQNYGHFKYFWELGRFHHLVSLAKAYYCTGDIRYAGEVKSQIESFVKQCPYLLGVHWTMPMETGLRLVSVCWIVAYLKEYLKTEVSFCKTLEELILSHARFTEQNFSAFSSANNHLIGEVLGVYMAASCFRQLPGMDKSLKRTYDILNEELFLQFNADGGNREQSTHYHISCLNCFLMAALLGVKNGLDFSDEYWRLIEKSIEFVMSLSDESNGLIQIGDSDDGKTIDFGDPRYNQVQSLLATGAALFKRSDFKKRAGAFDQMSFWLLGSEGRQIFEQLPDESFLDRKIVSFPQTGYYIVESEQSVPFKLVFDCGPLGFKSIAGHGHADSLSVVLMAYGKSFLIDPGTYIYESENPYRNYFRSTKAHNTIVIDGKDQSVTKGPFMWAEKAESFFERLSTQKDKIFLAGSHDGYMRLENPVEHRREIQVHPDESRIILTDILSTTGTHFVELFFHFSPSCLLTEAGDHQYVIENGDKCVTIIMDPKLSHRIIKGQKDPIGGWMSHRYGSKEQIYTLCGYCNIQKKQTFNTEICLRAED